MKLHELLDIGELLTMIDTGYIRVRSHPTLPYAIYNYTEKAAYENVWNDSTMTCRGLIVDGQTDEILARPFPKFFNYGQTGAAEIGLSELVQVTDKMDGSLGILYPTPDGYAIATRGSFESDQAIHATKVLREKYPDFDPYPDVTYLFEIIFPENRIVLDYGDQDDLVFLGGVVNESGIIVGPSPFLRWDGPQTKTFEHGTLAEALSIEPRPNAEGLVIRSIMTGAMIKLKQADYIALHRIVTGLSEKTVWEALSNETFDDLVEKVPDEFHIWMESKRHKFFSQFWDIMNDAAKALEEIELALSEEFGVPVGIYSDINRRDLAKKVMEYPKELRPILFKMADGQPFDDIIWKQIKPVGATPMKIVSEDTA